MTLKKLFFILFFLVNTGAFAQQKPDAVSVSGRYQKKAERRERINQLIRQEEEGALIFHKQSALGFKMNSDGWGTFYEHGKYKTMSNTKLWWLELGEHKHVKEERVPTVSASQGFIVMSSYIYGKQNNFFYLNAGLGQQKLIGGKSNKNGVAVSAIYGGGLSAGLLKPYYLDVQNSTTGKREFIRYTPENEAVFLDATSILGKAGLAKGLKEIKFVPGAHARAALRFDYGKYNEMISAIEVGLNAAFYSQKMPILLMNKEKNFFFNAYAAITFGKRK